MTNFTIDCTGDACTGDTVRFERAVFTGSWRKPKFSHTEIIEGTIISDSYGQKKQQHTFTLRLPDGSTTRIKGRNLYRNGCRRQPWSNEEARKTTLEDKHHRGDMARACRSNRREPMAW